MLTASTCTTGSLAPYTGPWTDRQIRHLYLRTGNGISPESIPPLLSVPAEQLVDQVIDDAIALPLATPPVWADWTLSDYPADPFPTVNEQYIEWIGAWMIDLFQNGLREKLALFWHNHFVTRLDTYQCPSYMYQYHRLLQQYAIGNFREFTVEMGKTPAMLFFLNGIQNTLISPNENYARELYELFTLGVDNGYTQQDIQETARALSGWNGFTEACAPVSFLPIGHDAGSKTIFGKTGNWGYDDVHNLLFSERATEVANFICQKVYTHFVHPEPDATIIEGMASTFLENNFEIAPVLRRLFKSEHFFDEKVIGTQVKSPVEYFLSYFGSGGFPFESEDIIAAVTVYVFTSGQELFSPVDVAGWPGNRSWIDSNTYTLRWESANLYNGYLVAFFPERLRALAKALAGEENTDPYVVAQSILDHFLPNGLYDPMAYEEATDIFKEPVPQNYYDRGLWNLDFETVPIQVKNLLDFMTQQPEFQLN